MSDILGRDLPENISNEEPPESDELDPQGRRLDPDSQPGGVDFDGVTTDQMAQDILTVDLARIVKEAQEEFGPAQLAINLSLSITDNDYLRDLIKYLRDDLTERVNG